VYTQDGTTPIFIAAENGHKECIEVLARVGCDVNKATVSVDGAVLSAVGGRGGVCSILS